MTKAEQLIWLSGGEVVYPPNKPIDKVFTRPVDCEVVEFVICESGSLKMPTANFLNQSEFNPHKVGSIIERECGSIACDDGRIVGWEGVDCDLCKGKGTQKRRVVSVTLKRLLEIEPDEPLETDKVEQIIELARNHPYLIVAQTEAIE